MAKYELPVKIIRDNVHGYIEVPLVFMEHFIAKENFQRLRHIEQTGMRVLYPSARHDRFVHSLGTFHLGCKAFACFRRNVRQHFGPDHRDEKRRYYLADCQTESEADFFWEKCGFLFKIACLLHDCGHAPFSHTFEFLYDFYGTIIDPENKGRTSLSKMLSSRCSDLFQRDFANPDPDRSLLNAASTASELPPGSPHERMSALVVLTEYSSIIRQLLWDYGYVADKESPEAFEAVELVARMIIRCLYFHAEGNIQAQIKNCLIKLINSDSIDVDSLDYIIRDQALSGIENTALDTDRLLSALTVVEKTKLDGVELVNANIDGSFNKASFVSNKHGPEISFKGRIKGGVTGIAGPFTGSMTGTIDLTGIAKVTSACPVVALPVSDHSHAEAKIFYNGLCLDTIPQTKDKSRVDFEFQTHYSNPSGNPESLAMQGDELALRDKFDAEITLKAAAMGPTSAMFTGILNGKVTNGDLLGYHPDLGGRIKLDLGYHKSALSILRNVLIARNYEYLWIFSHHKVVYYASYLLVELLRLSVKFLYECAKKKRRDPDLLLAELFSYNAMVRSPESVAYQNDIFGSLRFLSPMDSDVAAIFRHCHLLLGEPGAAGRTALGQKLATLLNEYYTREYRKSLWKSYAEFNIFFKNIPMAARGDLFEMLLEQKSVYRKAFGGFPEAWQVKLKEAGIDDVIWVNAECKLKQFDPDNTFILYKADGKIFQHDAVLNYSESSMVQKMESEKTHQFFYLYFRPVAGKDLNKEVIQKFFKDELLKYRANRYRVSSSGGAPIPDEG